jgi:cytochrome c oxidase subunit III
MIPMTTTTSARQIDVSHLPDIGFDWRSTLWWGNLLGIIIETVSVALLLATYFYVARNFHPFPPPRADEWPPLFDPVPRLGAATTNTTLLLLSCLPMYWTNQMARRKNRAMTMLGLAVMLVVTTASIWMRCYEFSAVHFRWDANAYGSIVWTLLGLHLIYLIIGLGEFLLMVLHIVLHPLDNKHALDVTLAAGYWYWTAGIWIFIYATIYWAPRWL